jgi:tripartite-type tricarboxylate transporter receptor subunit TctC
MLRRRLALLAGITLTLGLAAGSPCLAAEPSKFPDKPVRIIVPSTPGGTLDFLARVLSPKLEQMWGVPVVVDDRPGAGGIVGTQAVVQSPPDGHTLLFVATGFTINPAIYAKLPYDTVKDLAPVTILTSTANVLVANPKLKIDSMTELLAMARANPGKLTYAMSGVGTGGWLSGQLLRQMAHIDLLEIPYKGAGASTAAVVAGQTDLLFTDVGPALTFVKAGQLKPLAVSTLKRSPQLPDVPTLDESGVKGFQIDASTGVLAPGGTPPAVIARIQRDIHTAVHSKEIADKLAAQGYTPIASSPAQYEARIKDELKKWAELVKRANIKPQ